MQRSVFLPFSWKCKSITRHKIRTNKIVVHDFVSLAQRFEIETQRGTRDYVHSRCTSSRTDNLHETVQQTATFKCYSRQNAESAMTNNNLDKL